VASRWSTRAWAARAASAKRPAPEQALDGGACRQEGGVGEAAVGLGGVEAGGAGADGGGFGEGFPATEVGEQAFHIGGKLNDGLRGGLGHSAGGGGHGLAPGSEGGEQVRQFQQGEVRGADGRSSLCCW